MKQKTALIIILSTLLFWQCSQQINTKATNNEQNRYMRVMFYNVENLFDIYDDSLKQDQEYLPEGDRHWNETKYYNKLQNIAKVIIGVGEWNSPDIIGLAEIENRNTLNDLLNKTPLSELGYQIIHQESPDRRGIDVALLYRENQLTKINQHFIEIKFPFNNSKSKTRDLLLAEFKTTNNDTLDVFINHWPSRYGGQFKSEPNRLYLASVVRNNTDSLMHVSKQRKIIIMGANSCIS